jgi:hypothetical protein
MTPSCCMVAQLAVGRLALRRRAESRRLSARLKSPNFLGKARYDQKKTALRFTIRLPIC